MFRRHACRWLAVALPDVLSPEAGRMTTGNENRSYVAAHFALELAGVADVGTVRSIEGGGLKADVMTYQPSGTYERWRQLGKPKFEDIKLQVGTAMSQPFFDWISKF